MGYKSPYNKVGKVMPEMKNQSKSSLAMKESMAYMKDQSPLPMSPLKAHGDPDTPHSEKKKEAKPLTEKQKYSMAATAVGEDASFTLKTFDDPRSGRSIVETKRALKKKNPGLYQDLYGK